MSCNPDWEDSLPDPLVGQRSPVHFFLEIVMSNSQSQTAKNLTPNEALLRADSVQWMAVAKRANDPVTARVIVAYLDQHPQLREQRAGVYLAASEAIKRDQMRYAKAKQLGQQVASVARAVYRGFKFLFQLARKSSLDGLAKMEQQALPRAEPRADVVELAQAVPLPVVTAPVQTATAARPARVPSGLRRRTPVSALPKADNSDSVHLDANVIQFPVIVDPWADQDQRRAVN